MSAGQYRVYGYRWVVLGAFMFINLTIQTLWITYAPITGPAARAYGVGDFEIGLLAMSFMIAFVPLSLPASWAIDTYGIRIGVGVGAALMAVFGLMRGLVDGYPLVLATTIGIAVAQPFLLNAWTKVPALWFAPAQRATAVGLVTLANLVGTALGLVLTPVLIESTPIATVNLIYGGVAALSSALFLLLVRERPPTPPCPPEQEARALMLDGLRHALKIRSFQLYLLLSFIGLGIFNGVTTWVEGIVRPRGFTPTDAGLLGALMLGGGVLGAVVIPALSDRSGRRLPFLLLGFLLAVPGVAGLAFATSGPLLFASAFALGFFVVSTGPVGMQYAAEITTPTPEGTSNGLTQLVGQASVVFAFIMEAARSPDGAYTPGLLLAIVLLLAGALVTRLMREPAGAAYAAPSNPSKR